MMRDSKEPAGTTPDVPVDARDGVVDASTPVTPEAGDGKESSEDLVANEQSIPDLIRVVGSIVAPTALLTALLYYFGWVVTNAQAKVFGLDESALGYSTRDYLLRSTGAIFIPLGCILLVGVAWIWAHRVLSGWLKIPERRETVARLTKAFALSGAVMVAIGLVGVIRPMTMSSIVPPLLFSLGIPLCAYAGFLYGRLHPGRRPGGRESPLRLLNATIVVLLVALCVFWVIGEYAERAGRTRALGAATRLNDRPSVVVYSPQRLHIDASGVQETELIDSDSGEQFRYSGLRLLFRANGKYFMVSNDWWNNGITIVLPDTPEFRFEFIRAST